MPENESHEELWRSLENEPVRLSARQVCARARRAERNNVRAYWAVMVGAPVLAALYLRNLMQFRDAWLIGGTAWALGVVVYMAWLSTGRGAARMASAEPCLAFLRRDFEGRRRWALRMRTAVLLVAPGAAALLHAGGPLRRAEAMGVRAAWVLEALRGPAPWIAMGALLALLWLLLTLEARRLAGEIADLGGPMR